MIKALIFDFDGVLADTYKINFDLAKEFYPATTEQDFLDHHNGNVFEQPKIPYTKDDIEPYFRLQKERFNKTHFFPIIQSLQKLHEHYKLFIISGMTDDNIAHFLQLDNYHGLFEKVLGMTTHTSKAARFNMIFKDYHLISSECLFITDTIGDIIEAKKIGVQSIAVSWGYHDETLLKQHNPLAIVHNGEELLQTIKQYSN